MKMALKVLGEGDMMLLSEVGEQVGVGNGGCGILPGKVKAAGGKGGTSRKLAKRVDVE